MRKKNGYFLIPKREPERDHHLITVANGKLNHHLWLSKLGLYVGEVCGKEDRALSLLDANL